MASSTAPLRLSFPLRSLRETTLLLRFRSDGVLAVGGSPSKTARPRIKSGVTEKGGEGRCPLPSASYLFSPSGAGRGPSGPLGYAP